MAAEDDPELHPGEIIRLGREASVQFGPRPILARFIRLMAAETARTARGWCWLEVFELNPTGEASYLREVYVQPDGIYRIRPYAGRPTYTNQRHVRQVVRHLYR